LSDDTYYIQIRSFWDHVTTDFKKSLDELSKKSWVKKVILDLRNNWGWYLESVADMLSYFVPLDQPTAYVKYINQEQNFLSDWYDLVDFKKYRLIILENSWTASASEIMIWSIKDYYPEATIIWEKSYGKWSVQTVKPYIDGSSLKYTIAKWFTWKTRTWIDKVGIKPDIELELNMEDFKKWLDNQLDKAKSMN
jgi:carboxyl-terminal processing protease